jgi:membrane-bound ClpP family serine protease
MAIYGNVEELWTNKNKNSIHGPLRWVYKILLTISFVSGLYLIWYMYKFCPKNDAVIYTGSVLLLLFSIVWAFRPFFYSNVILGLVFIGAILILAGIVDIARTLKTVDVIAIVAACILVIQTGLLDFGVWTGNIK